MSEQTPQKNEYKLVWFWYPKNNSIFTDNIYADENSSYYNVFVIECGPTQLAAKMHDDHTVQRVRYRLRGIDTRGMLWADSREELEELMKRPRDPNKPKEDWEVEDDFKKKHRVNKDTKCCGNCKHCGVNQWKEASCAHPELDFTDRSGKKYNIKMEVDVMTVCDAWETKESI